MPNDAIKARREFANNQHKINGELFLNNAPLINIIQIKLRFFTT